MNGFDAPKISVIIPLYNLEKYIGATLGSIHGQTFADYEVIVVDDCSTDNGPALVKSLTDKFNGRLKILQTKTNSGGAGAPSNMGVSAAKGKYVYIMDGDDLIADVALAELYETAEEYAADVVYMNCGAAFYSANDHLYPLPEEIESRNWQQGGYEKKTVLETSGTKGFIDEFLRVGIGWPAWEKLVRRDLLIENRILFPEHIPASSDIVWTIQLLFFTERLARISTPLYFYRQHPASVCHRERSPKENLEFWSKINLESIMFLQNFLSRQKFIEENPEYEWNLINMLHRVHLEQLRKNFPVLPKQEIYKILSASFKKNYGEGGALLAYFFTSFMK